MSRGCNSPESILYGSAVRQYYEEQPLIVGEYKSFRPTKKDLALDYLYISKSPWSGTRFWQLRGKMPDNWLYKTAKLIPANESKLIRENIQLASHTKERQLSVRLGKSSLLTNKPWREIIDDEQRKETGHYVNANHLQGMLNYFSDQEITALSLLERMQNPQYSNVVAWSGQQALFLLRAVREDHLWAYS